MRLSLKIFNCTPGELPQGLRDQLCSWLCATPAGAEGYIRPGCVHLTIMVGLLPTAVTARDVSCSVKTSVAGN